MQKKSTNMSHSRHRKMGVVPMNSRIKILRAIQDNQAREAAPKKKKNEMFGSVSEAMKNNKR